MLLLDVIIRYPAVTLLLLFAVMALREGRHHPSVLYAALVTVTVAALLLGTPHPDLVLPEPAHALVRFADVPSVALIWWLGRSLFEDDFALGKFEWAGMTAIVIPVFAFRLNELGIIGEPPMYLYLQYFVSGLSILLMVHLTWIAISGRHDDVIESRRRARTYFVVGLIAATILVIVGERLFYMTHPIELSIFRAAITLPIPFFAILWLTEFRSEKLSFDKSKPIEPAQPQIDPRDQILHAALVAEMQEKQAYTEHGLTIRSLAERLNTPEHRLRALINQGMGYRNFSSFVNFYRIEAVKQAMQQPEHARTPVLTLAMEVGFSSLAPFNRAFSSITGQTPTAYRANLMQNAD